MTLITVVEEDAIVYSTRTRHIRGKTDTISNCLDVLYHICYKIIMYSGTTQIQPKQNAL